MRQIRTHARSDDESDLNLTPMLDVVFIMLIFFIVTATFIKQAGIDVFRPDAMTYEQKPTVSVLVAISESGRSGSTRSRSIPPRWLPTSNGCISRIQREVW